MTILEMLQQSAVLTMLGMTIVFVFLALLVYCINLTGKLINRVNPESDIENPKTDSPLAKETAQPEIIAAISVAVNEYRNGTSK
jgi:oxaloacetate decarboxylase gamma subunit